MFCKNIFNWARTQIEYSGRDRLRPVPSAKGRVSYDSIKLMIVLCGFLMLSACAGLSVHGTVGGQTIKTRVDSEVARYYVGSYLSGERSDAVLDERIDRVYQSANGNLPDRDELKHLSDEFSVDFAALYFADQIARMPANQRFRRDVEQAYDYAREAFPEGRVSLPADYEVLVVPLYLYKRRFAVGADLSGPREALEKAGLTTHFVETDDDGAVEANADVVADAIRARAERPPADHFERQQVRSRSRTRADETGAP
jgi:hypothetical protein